MEIYDYKFFFKDPGSGSRRPLNPDPEVLSMVTVRLREFLSSFRTRDTESGERLEDRG